MSAKYEFNINAPNLRAATNLLTAISERLKHLARCARLYNNNGFRIRANVNINRCRELYEIYRQVKKQWEKMEY